MDVKSLTLFLILISVGTLAGCGNKDDLYLPDYEPKQQ